MREAGRRESGRRDDAEPQITLVGSPRLTASPSPLPAPLSPPRRHPRAAQLPRLRARVAVHRVRQRVRAATLRGTGARAEHRVELPPRGAAAVAGVGIRRRRQCAVATASPAARWRHSTPGPWWRSKYSRARSKRRSGGRRSPACGRGSCGRSFRDRRTVHSRRPSSTLPGARGAPRSSRSASRSRRCARRTRGP